MGGFSGAGGPPLMVFVSAFNISKNECRATLAMNFLFFEPARAFVIFYLHDRFDASRWPVYLSMGISAYIALAVGNILVAPRVDKDPFHKLLVVILLLGSSMMMLADTAISEYVAISVAT